jgi:hypothetical protein
MKINLRNLVSALYAVFVLSGCPIVRATGDAVEATGEGVGHAVEGTGDAIGRAGHELTH